MPRSGGDFRGAHSREFDYVEEESDDLFEDEQSFSPQPRRRATPQDYSQAYREFDGETQERRRTGPILLIAALVAVGAIAGGLIYFYQSSAGTQATSAENVPVVDEPSAPVKTEPQPAETAEDSAPPAQEQSMAPATEMQAGAQKKQIYDRILGETTLEEQEQVVPSEEQPVPPQGEQSQGFDADPLPLPMPPAPGGGTDDQGSLDSPGAQTTAAAKSASETASQQASPASATLETEPAEQSEAALATPAPSAVPAAANEPEPPLPQPEPVQASEEQPAPLQQSEEQPPAAISQQKAPSAEKKIESELAFAEQQGAAATQASEGPIQIAQLPGFDASASTGTTTFAPLPQALPDLTEGSSSEGGSTARRPRPIGFRESDKVVANVNRNFNRAKQVQVAQIEADPITTQSVTAAPSAPQAAAPAPQPAPSQQQAALEPAPKPQITHGTGSGFTIQLASYKSEGDAVAGYEQLRQQHGQLIGSLTPNIQKADLGANGTFYRLHLGSFSSKEAAKKTCTSLLAAGERDCIVKSR
jgi:cell division septation protein DedD